MLTALFAASLFVTDPTVKTAAELQTQAENLTMTYLFCERHLPASAWENFRPLAAQLGVTDNFVREARQLIARTPPPRGINTEVCVTAVVRQGNVLIESVRRRQQLN
jgi:hypothetical protein